MNVSFAQRSPENVPNTLARVAVVGTSGAGKTTFARSLSRALGTPHVELDALYWGPNWTPVPQEEFRARVASAVRAPTWIIDGNYSPVRDLVWRSATSLVWLNYPFPLVFSRALARTARRIVTRETLFADNRETLDVFNPGWIPWWILRTFWQRRRDYPRLFQDPAHSHLQVIEFTHPNQADAFLRKCAETPVPP